MYSSIYPAFRELNSAIDLAIGFEGGKNSTNSLRRLFLSITTLSPYKRAGIYYRSFSINKKW